MGADPTMGSESIIKTARERMMFTHPARRSVFGLSNSALSHNFILFANRAAKLFPPRRCTRPREYRSVLWNDRKMWMSPDMDCVKSRTVVNQFHRSEPLVVPMSLLLGRTQPPLTVTAATRRSMMVPGRPVHQGSARSKATESRARRELKELPESVMFLRGNINEGILSVCS